MNLCNTILSNGESKVYKRHNLIMQVYFFPEIRIPISICVFSMLSLHVGLYHSMLFGMRERDNNFSNSFLYDCHRWRGLL